MDPDLLDADFATWQRLSASSGDPECAGAPLPRPSNAPSPDPLRLLHEEVLGKLRQVIDPDIGRDIVALGFVRDLEILGEQGEEADVKFCLRLTTPACPFKDQLQRDAEAAVRRLPWVKKVEVTLDSLHDFHAASVGRPPNLKRVEFVVGVASCKGGSGKSTVSLSLALMLRRSGAKVGLLDADIYGPSLPTLLQMEGARVRFAVDAESESDEDGEKEHHKPPHLLQNRRSKTAVRRTRIEYEGPFPEGPARAASKEAPSAAAAPEANPSMLPIVVSGIKCMSYGFIAKENEQGYSALRGPFVSSVVEQLLTGTRWGALDYLVVDLPPGTGDIHITLTQQQVPLDGCVVVTTPQALSLVDAEKGIRMLKSLSIPTLSVVCNMAYFVCDSCDKRHMLYGNPEATQQLAELSSARHLLVLPFDVRLNSTTFAGSPLPDAKDSFVDKLGPEDKVWQQLRVLADRVACELSTIRFGSLKPQPSLTPDGCAVLVALVRPSGALAGEANVQVMVKEIFEISGEILRRRCRCVDCTARQSGSLPLKTGEDKTLIEKLTEAQDEAVNISWADGHESRFSHADLLDLCRQLRMAESAEGGSTCHADPKLEW